MSWDIIHEHADAFGIFSIPAVRAAGIDLRWLKRRFGERSLLEVVPDVGRCASGDLPWRASVRAGLLHAGPPVAVAGPTALLLHGLDLRPVPRRIHLVAPYERGPSALDERRFRWHHTRRWWPERLVEVDGMASEAVADAIVRCASWTRPDDRVRFSWLRDVVGDAVVRDLTTIPDLLEATEFAGRISQRRTVHAALVALDPRSVRARSRPEVEFANLCVDGGLPEPVLNHPVHHDRDGLLGVLDAAWLDRERGVEIDSIAHHLGVKAGTYDNSRQQRIEDLTGWRLRRFWTWEVRDHPRDVLRRTARFLDLVV